MARAQGLKQGVTRKQLEALRRLAFLAGCIVLETPKRSSGKPTSYVRRSLISELEHTLDDAGYDMATARKLYREAMAKKPAAVSSTERLGAKMPWCDRCQCYHMPQAEHIGGPND